jgi:hypothetical protein
MLDFSQDKYSTKKANTEGVQYIFCDPATGEELFEDDDETKPVCAYLLGKDSKEYKAYISEIESKFRGKKAPVGSKAKQLGYDLLARCTLRFERVGLNGKEVESSHAGAVDFYKACDWAREQVDNFIVERANFLGR